MARIPRRIKIGESFSTSLDEKELSPQALGEALIRERLRKGGVTFIEFCETMLTLTLSIGQKEVARVLFDGEQPAEDYRDAVFGGLSNAPTKKARRVALALCGRGSGKTRIFLAARAMHLALTVDLSPLAPSEAGLVPIIAPDQRASRHTLSFVKGFFENLPMLKAAVEADWTLDSVRLKRPDGRYVSIESRAASAGGRAVRGPSLAGVMLDEAAFFYGEGYEVNDGEIYRAARPRMLPGSQIVFATTPWAQTGKVWEIYRDDFGKCEDAVVARAPTLLMHPTEENQSAYDEEKENDPDNAAREYDAQFLSADAERFFTDAAIERCLVRTLSVPDRVLPGERVRFGADFAFVQDSSALVGFVARPRKISESVTETHWQCCSLIERRPEADHPLKPSVVCAEFAEEMKRCGGKIVCADAHYRVSIEEHLAAYKLAVSEASPDPAESFVVTRALMNQGLVELPNHPRLLAQLRKVRATMRPGGRILMHQPRSKEGGHGDLVSALVCALAGATLETTIQPPSPETRAEAEAMLERANQTKRLIESSKDRAKEDEKKFRWMKRNPTFKKLLSWSRQ